MDVLARQVVEPGQPALKAIESHFGASVIQENGTLNREALGQIVFNDPAQRAILNKITHPAVRKAMARQIFLHWLRGVKVCVVDAPLLIEAGLWRFCGKIVIVYCSKELQIKRLASRNQLSREQAESRISAQAPLDSKIPYADYLIVNEGSLEEFMEQLKTTTLQLKQDAGWSWFLSRWIPPLGLVKGLCIVFYRLFIKVCCLCLPSTRRHVWSELLHMYSELALSKQQKRPNASDRPVRGAPEYEQLYKSRTAHQVSPISIQSMSRLRPGEFGDISNRPSPLLSYRVRAVLFVPSKGQQVAVLLRTPSRVHSRFFKYCLPAPVNFTGPQ